MPLVCPAGDQKILIAGGDIGNDRGVLLFDTNTLDVRMTCKVL